jgi:hypothetical protein
VSPSSILVPEAIRAYIPAGVAGNAPHLFLRVITEGVVPARLLDQFLTV